MVLIISLTSKKNFRPYIPIEICLRCDCCGGTSPKVECKIGEEDPSQEECALLSKIASWFSTWRRSRKGSVEHNLCRKCSTMLFQKLSEERATLPDSLLQELQELRAYVDSLPSESTSTSSSNSSSAQPSGSF